MVSDSLCFKTSTHINNVLAILVNTNKIVLRWLKVQKANAKCFVQGKILKNRKVMDMGKE